jgi:transcriptional regulator
MYIPSFNKFDDTHEVISFMQRYSFATIVTVMEDVPVATHLPFVVKADGDKLILRSHFAKANTQADNSIGKNVLVIFSEPHAYISPENYEKQENVPTWNYLAIHIYGKCILLDSPEEKAALLAETIKTFDDNYTQQWTALPETYRQKMMNGIVAFEIEVNDIQAKAKLSQNRSFAERENIIETFDKSDDSNEKAIAAYMKQLAGK